MTEYLDREKAEARSKAGVAVRRTTPSTVIGQGLCNTRYRSDTGPKRIRAKTSPTSAPAATCPRVPIKIVSRIAATVIVATLRNEIAVLE
jgi:hypothetical protein